MGGAVAAIESGYYQQAILDEAYEWEQAGSTSGERVVVGVNRYADEEARLPERFDVPADVASDQRERLAALRAERDQPAVDAALARLVAVAGGEDNAMPAIVAAVDAEASLGEICGALRQVFGDYRPAAAAQI